jgi:hypothetical protein
MHTAFHKIFSQLHSRPSRLSDTAPIALAGTWCAPGIREGGGVRVGRANGGAAG